LTDYLALAREAAIEAHGKTAVGEYSHTVQEGQDNVLTYLFTSKLKGYPDWFIAVTLFIDGWEATVSEVLLTPGETSLVAPKWVPWSERLADYKALQAALEAEAAAAAALAEDEDEDEEDDSEESDVDIDGEAGDVGDGALSDVADGAADAAKVAAEAAEESAVADVPETPEAQSDADTTGGKAKGLFKWKTLRGNKKRK
jgi:hypothetical protein